MDLLYEDLEPLLDINKANDIDLFSIVTVHRPNNYKRALSPTVNPYEQYKYKRVVKRKKKI
jgi:hypothetical protein